MVDGLIILIVIVLLFFAMKGSVKHFKGEGACCGGSHSSEKAEEKHLNGPVTASRSIVIDGMHCSNCAHRVQEAINKIDGASATVDFNSGRAIVSMDRTIDDIELRKAVKDAGYTVRSIAPL